MKDKSDGPHTMRFTDGTPGGITFYPFAAAVAWDYLLERGYEPRFLSDGESQQDFKARIQGKLRARSWPVTALGTRVSAETQWFQWAFVWPGEDLSPGSAGYALWTRPSWRILAWVRQGKYISTEDLFRELKQERTGRLPRAASFPWARATVTDSAGIAPPWSHIRDADGFRVSPRLPEHWLSDPRVRAWREAAERAREPVPPPGSPST